MTVKAKIWLDSGAYAVWNRGTEIDLSAYIRFIQTNLKNLTYYVNLDVIPGVKFRESTHEEVEESARKGFENFLTMRKEGLEPIPVYHFGEDRKWLEKMLDAGSPYIGLALGRQGADVNSRKWLDSIFDRLCNTSSGLPMVKTHGFGLTAASFLFRYPWFSVDSTTWIFAAAYGRVLFPRMSSDGKIDWSVTPLGVGFTNRESSEVMHRPDFYDCLGLRMKKFIDDYLADTGFGIDHQMLKDNYYARVKMNGYYMQQVALNRRLKPYDVPVVQGFFDTPKGSLGVVADMPQYLEMVNVAGLNNGFNQILTEIDSKNRLISYADMSSDHKEIIELLVKTGRTKEQLRDTSGTT